MNYIKEECSSCCKESNKTVNVRRFIDTLDGFFGVDDLEGAKRHLDYWENEAKKLGDKSAYLTILNEKIGFSRRINDKAMADASIASAQELLYDNTLDIGVSAAIIKTNIATTKKALGDPLSALEIYKSAADDYIKYNLCSSYEYAALLNNRATSYTELEKYDMAQNDFERAIEILQNIGHHDNEIAVSYVNFAAMIYEKEKDIQKVNALLDIAWDYINSESIIHDDKYAFAISKCAPTFLRFGRTVEAEALDDTAREIYQGRFDK